MVGGAWLAGIAMRRRREQLEAVAALATQRELAREAEVRAAVADERTTIARDLHDVVAHAIGVIVVQARGARHAIDGDREAALTALDAIESTAVTALAEMRRLVGIMRDDASPAQRRPRPGIRALPSLVAQMEEAGLVVDLRIEGTTVDLSPGVDLSAYRIVQEALTNVLDHSGSTTATVIVRYGAASLELDVLDDGPAGTTAEPRPGPVPSDGMATPGHGLTGIQERVALVGGDVAIGARPEGGFAVRARLPLTAPES